MIDSLTEAYLAHCVAERTPPNTIYRRRSVLNSLPNAGAADRDAVEAWWASTRGLAPASRANALGCLRSFYKWCRVWEHRDDDPTLRITAPKVPDNLPRPVSRVDLHRLLDVLPADLRRAVALGAYAGLRVSEAAVLAWSDVDVEARRARVEHSKGGRSRLVAISPLLIDVLLPDLGGNVVTGTENAYTTPTLNRKVNRAIRAAGVDATFHQLRHRYGTLAYQATGDLLAVSRQMGHSSVVTTQIYAAASDTQADVIAAAVAR